VEIIATLSQKNSAEVRPLQALRLVLEADWNLDCTALGDSPPCFQIIFH
jgi:hypothetical protein